MLSLRDIAALEDGAMAQAVEAVAGACTYASNRVDGGAVAMRAAP